ncbi:hypothetical protein D3Z51_19360 [Clostridiaceae bacterium]|nr:hypothetical protein [Clostridiaceae bacterium]RKI08213.1 hypothetical protein D7V81_19290 [bacterium 1XD21-70]
MEPPKAARTTTWGWNRPGCDGGESRKKRADGAWREPVHRDNGRSAAKPPKGERPTTILCRSRAKRPEAVCPAPCG